MSKKVELHLIDDIPDEVLEDIGRFLKCYTTALTMQTVGSGAQESIRMIGSGTFVSISNRYGILTAAHVVKELTKEESLGRPYLLNISVKDYKHSYTIRSNYLEPLIIAKGQIDSDGPDLGFIVLPPSELGKIKATKNFHNLDRNRERILTTPPNFSEGIWAICGVPDEKTVDVSENNFKIKKRYFMLTGVGVIENTYIVDDYDYCDIKVKHDISPIIPYSFGGVSGGGLWHIPLAKSREGVIEPIEYILSGVVFYETGWEGLYQSLRCHGRNSIYDKAYSFITENRKPKTENSPS